MQAIPSLIRTCLFAVLLASWGISGASAAGGDEEPDGLPGVLNGPSRQDVADLIRKVGRDEATDAKVDEILSFFRPRSKDLKRDFPKISRTVLDPRFVAQMDAIAKELTGKPADTRNLFVRALNKNIVGMGTAYDLRIDMVDELKRRAEEPVTLRGKIVDDREKPIPNVVVSTSAAMTKTDDKGNFVLKFRRPKVPFSIVSFEAKGYALCETTFDFESLEDANDRTYPLVKQAVCNGKVVDQKGNPIAGAEVELYIREEAFRRGFDDGGLVRQGRNSFVTLRATSGEDGRYAFRGLPPRGELPIEQYAFSISASHPKYMPNSDNFLDDQEPRANITIPLSVGCSISGVVTDAAGKAVPLAPVRVLMINGRGALMNSQTDAKGEFRFENVPPQDVRIVVEPDDFMMEVVPATAKLDEPAKLKITVKPGEFIEGTVIGPDGKPAGNAAIGWLNFVNEQGQPALGEKPVPERTTRSAKDGTFRLGPLPEGSYQFIGMIEEPEQVQASVIAKTGQKGVMIRLDGQGNEQNAIGVPF